jgi:1-acyl-sn-glycerol-3-phosphate acyltransferase
MVALQEAVPVVPGAIHGSQTWQPGNFAPVSVAWGEPMRFDGLPRNAKGYREASAEVQREIRRLWDFLVELHSLGRPGAATPP